MTVKEESADKLHIDWILSSARNPESFCYNYNLLIVSEDEFLKEYGEHVSFQEMLSSSVAVYDADSEFVLSLGR